MSAVPATSRPAANSSVPRQNLEPEALPEARYYGRLGFTYRVSDGYMASRKSLVRFVTGDNREFVVGSFVNLFTKERPEDEDEEACLALLVDLWAPKPPSQEEVHAVIAFFYTQSEAESHAQKEGWSKPKLDLLQEWRPGHDVCALSDNYQLCRLSNLSVEHAPSVFREILHVNPQDWERKVASFWFLSFHDERLVEIDFGDLPRMLGNRRLTKALTRRGPAPAHGNSNGGDDDEDTIHVGAEMHVE